MFPPLHNYLRFPLRRFLFLWWRVSLEQYDRLMFTCNCKTPEWNIPKKMTKKKKRDRKIEKKIQSLLYDRMHFHIQATTTLIFVLKDLGLLQSIKLPIVEPFQRPVVHVELYFTFMEIIVSWTHWPHWIGNRTLCAQTQITIYCQLYIHSRHILP